MGLPNKRPIESARRIKNVCPTVLTNLTHEFLTPISVISSNIQILERLEESISEPSSDKRKLFMSNIKAQVERLSEVVHDSMELLKLDTLNEEVNLVEVDLVEMFEGIIPNIKLCNQKLLFSNQISAESFKVMTDQRLLRISVFRLVNHACSTYKKKIPEIIIRATDEVAFIEILNHDVSLDEEDFAHIFNPFHRTAEMEKIEGMSLALTIIKDRLRLINANFRVSQIPELESGHGVKYSIEFKRALP